ncbi:unnamed protein product [Lymnaea stagnalis]|uniref:Uncharacterized protein n=1 Tax=Lymnaea stagnalis TaxID=6523 RepID=A0AAV2HB98_LYMST
MAEHQMLFRNFGNRLCKSKVVGSPKYIITNDELCVNASLKSRSEGKDGSQDRSSQVKRCIHNEENPDNTLTVMDSTFVIQSQHSVAEKNVSMAQDLNADSDKVDGWVEHKLGTLLDKMSVRPNHQGQETDSSGSFHGLKDISSSSTLGEGLLRPDKLCANVLPDLQTCKKPAENPGSEFEDELMKIETAKSAPEVDGCDFEFREFYIDDDFEDGERVSSRPLEDLDCNVSTRHNSTDCLPDKSRHVTKHVQAKSPFSLARLIIKPPVPPSKWPIVHHTNSRGNMSQSALRQNEEDINKMRWRKSHCERVTETKDEPSFSVKNLKGDPAPRGREGVPAEPKLLTSNSSLGHGTSDPGISLSSNDVSGKVNDDDTLVEVDGDLNTVSDADTPDTVRDKEINRKVSAVRYVTAPSQLTKVNESCQVSMPGDRPKTHYDSDAAESDPWVHRKLKIIQEKIRRRKARASYTLSSDDDEDPGYVGTDDQLLPLASPGSNYMLPWEQFDPCPDIHPSWVLSSTEHKMTKNHGLVDKRDYKSHKNGGKTFSPATHRRSHENKKIKYNPNLSDIASNNSRAVGIDTSEKLRQDECTTENSSDQHKSATASSLEHKCHDGLTEIKHPSILRRTSKISSSYKLKEGKSCLNQVPTRVPRTKSKVSASHGSKSTERVISFKDLTDTDHDKPSTSKFKTQTHLTRPESEVTEQSPQLERSFVSVSEDFEIKTVKTWLEKHNFAESSCTSSPQPTDHHHITSRVLELQNSQSGIQNTPSNRSVFSEHSLDKVPFIYKEDAIHKNPKAITPQRQEVLSWINSDVGLKEHNSNDKFHRGKSTCSIQGQPEGQVSRCDDDDLTEAKEQGNFNVALSHVRHKSYNPIPANEHFVTLDLQTPAKEKLESQTGKQRKQKCKLGLHRFYIPRDMWPEGCNARLDVSISPTHPDCHRVVTTATDPVSGREETLMDQTICTDKLRSTLQLD